MQAPLSKIICGDCVDVMKRIEDNTFDAVVTDPPYGLGKQPNMRKVLRAWLEGEKADIKGAGFMGKEWDSFVPGPRVWSEVFRVLKPGGHVLVFAGTRTFDLMSLALRLSGFEIVDCLSWLYGSGMPKGADISKMIDKAAGAKREVVGSVNQGSCVRITYNGPDAGRSRDFLSGPYDLTTPVTADAKRWEGWRTQIKPAWEPVIWARKPLTPVRECAILAAEVEALLGGGLWALLYDVKCANVFSRSTPPGFVGGGSVGAQWIANVQHGVQKSPSALTDMCKCSEEAFTLLNIALSWQSISGALSSRGNKSTISTEIELTTALRTLKFLILQSIPDCITRVALLPAGLLSPVDGAGKSSSAANANTSDTPSATVGAHATLLRGIDTDSAVDTAASNLRAVLPVVSSVVNSVITLLDEAIEPAWEPILVAMKPREGTFANNALVHGVAGFAIDRCRLGERERKNYGLAKAHRSRGVAFGKPSRSADFDASKGRFPANVVLDEEAAGQLDEQAGTSTPRKGKPRKSAKPGEGWGSTHTGAEYDDEGGRSRFFYCAKASRREREAGLQKPGKGRANTHPTVKPIALMRWLCRLVSTPENTMILDPFMGSGTTGVACALEGFGFTGVEQDEVYVGIARQRIAHWQGQAEEGGG